MTENDSYLPAGGGECTVALTQDDIEVLSKTALFADLDRDQLRALIGNATPRLYPKGRVLFQQEDSADRFYAVLDGWVKLSRQSRGGDEVILGVFCRGETFAEAAMFLNSTFPVTAEVVDDARLLTFQNDVFRARLRDDPELGLGMLASTSRHLKHLVEHIEQVKGRPGPQRVAGFILSLCPIPDGSAVVGLPYEKSLIAARLGMKPESLSRALARLRRLGIRSERNHIVVSDVAMLAAFVEDGESGLRAFRG